MTQLSIRLASWYCMVLPPLSYFTKIHASYKNGKAIRPIIAATATRAGLLTFQRNRTTLFWASLIRLALWAIAEGQQCRLRPREWVLGVGTSRARPDLSGQ